MSVLSNIDITKWMEKKEFSKRLIITPCLDLKESLDYCSFDVRLSNQFIIMKRRSYPHLDIKNNDINRTYKYQEKVNINNKNSFVLHPHQLVLGATLEYVKIPDELMCYVIGKSSWGRTGLVIATATKVDPGFKGCITLELVNEGEIPISLYPGLPIAQLVFHEVTEELENGYSGGYKCAIGPQFPELFNKNPEWNYWITEK